jgi:hypothetical protein
MILTPASPAKAAQRNAPPVEGSGTGVGRDHAAPLTTAPSPCQRTCKLESRRSIEQGLQLRYDLIDDIFRRFFAETAARAAMSRMRG